MARNQPTPTEPLGPEPPATEHARTESSRGVAYALYGAAAAAALVAASLVDRLAKRLPRVVAEPAVMAALVGGGWITIAAPEQLRPHREGWNRSDGAGGQLQLRRARVRVRGQLRAPFHGDELGRAGATTSGVRFDRRRPG